MPVVEVNFASVEDVDEVNSDVNSAPEGLAQGVQLTF